MAITIEEKTPKKSGRRADPANAAKRADKNAWQLAYYYRNREKIMAYQRQYRSTQVSPKDRQAYNREYQENLKAGEVSLYEFLTPATKRNCYGTLACLRAKKAEHNLAAQREVIKRNIWLLEMHRIKMRKPADITRCNNTIDNLKKQLNELGVSDECH
jgi:hypothetical protein